MGRSPDHPATTPQHTSQRAASALSQASPSETRPAVSVNSGRDAEKESRRPTDDYESPVRSSIADSELAEMDPDGHPNDDEESNLTSHERKKRLHMRRRQLRALDSRTVDLNISLTGRRIADRTVLKRLTINGLFIVLWYIFSLSISVYNKWMFSPEHLNFKFPLFTTSIHMAVQFVLATAILYFLPSLRPRRPASQLGNQPAGQSAKPLLSLAFYLTRLVPCGVATSLDVGLGNMSLKFITLSFLTMCKSSALGFVLFFAFIFRLESPSMKLILIICAMILGVVMMVAGEPDFNVVGFGLVIASAFFSGFRWGLTQILLLRHPATSNPFSTLFLLTPIMFVSLTIISLLVEGPNETRLGIEVLAAQIGSAKVALLLIFPGTLAFCMIASEFALLKRSSVVTLSICGIFKEVITIITSGSVFDDKLTPVNLTGLVVTIASIASYNYMKINKMRKEARKDIAVNVDDSNDENDDENDSQPQTSGPRSWLIDRLGATFGTSSGSNEGGKYQSVYSPARSPVETQFAAGVDGNSILATPVIEGRGRPARRARGNGPGPSPLGSHATNQSGTPPDGEGSNRMSPKDNAFRSGGRSVLASDFSDAHASGSPGVRERSSSRPRSSQSRTRLGATSPPTRN